MQAKPPARLPAEETPLPERAAATTSENATAAKLQQSAAAAPAQQLEAVASAAKLLAAHGFALTHSQQVAIECHKTR
eukprot:134924-Amphidinium_carterae.1